VKLQRDDLLFIVKW